MKNIINIVNFVRGVEPRPGRNIDLKLPVREQIRIMREQGLTGTFLLQYDALIDPEFQAIIDTCRDFCEIGMWLEIMQPLVEAIGEEWHGRYAWDWYNDVGFLIGYEPEVRLRLIDECMRKFKEIYGYYPESVGSWHVDSVSMKYLSEKYHVKACCICRDQVGTDGYTMQGGYYNQAYYPSVNNMFCPAQTEEYRIDMPVFRMLGSDPIYAYDFQVFKYDGIHCPTLEAAQDGRNDDWNDWLIPQIFSGDGLAFQYTQIGQENSFGWPRMGHGIEYQFPIVKAMADRGEAEIMTLRDCGEWYSKTFKDTPPATLTATRGWKGEDTRSIWYYSRYYRTNLMWNDGVVKFRDLYMFNEKYEELYLHERCDTHACQFRNLPVMDGVIYTDLEKGIVAGIYLSVDGTPVHWDHFAYTEGNNCATVTLKGALGEATVICSEKAISIATTVKGLTLQPVYDREKVLGNAGSADSFANHNNSKTNLTYISSCKTEGNEIRFTFDGFDYGVKVEKGSLDASLSVVAEAGEMRIVFS